MKQLIRTARGAVIALALALVVAAPAAAAQPTRTVIDLDPLTRQLPAGTFCDFDVTVQRPGGWLSIMDFSDGREALVGHAVGRIYTNDATGATFAASTSAHEVDRFDPDSTLVRGVVTGEFNFEFLPGDVGPDGVVIDHLLELHIQGQATYVYDSNTSATLEFVLQGTATDICAAIS
ncbi:MAG: hypothetical protein HY263_08915 [Chloroflexi bacterium]|nr:hypothetical protein [Chloroflexota bacterium]